MVLALATVALIARFKMKPSIQIEHPFGFLIVLPFFAFFIFSNLAVPILVFLGLAAVLFFTQLPAFDFSDYFRKPASGWGKAFERVSIGRAVAMAAAIGLGIWLMVGARAWAYSIRQFEEIREKALYSQYQDLQPLLSGNYTEYFRLDGAGLEVKHSKTMSFGGGDDKYSLTYALLTDSNFDRAAVHDWPIWVFCRFGYKTGKWPMVFRASRCTVGRDCSAQFLKIRDRLIREYFHSIGAKQQSSGPVSRIGQELIELEPETDMARTATEWWDTIFPKLALIAIAQAVYSLCLFLAALFVRRRLFEVYPDSKVE